MLGAAGFAAGFFGPLVFAPDSNQGPLVGILMSGPGGALLGGLIGGMCKLLRISPSRQRLSIWVFSFVLAIVTLCSIMPSPALRGDIEEVQINTCKRPIEAIDDAITGWNTQFASGSPATRAGWQEDSRRMLRDDEGVILGITIVRARTLLEERTPWHRGNILASSWRTVDAEKSYYARFAGGSCSDYATGTHAILFNDRFFGGVPANLGWPPRKVANFLDLQTIDPVPNPYREFAGD